MLLFPNVLRRAVRWGCRAVGMSCLLVALGATAQRPDGAASTDANAIVRTASDTCEAAWLPTFGDFSGTNGPVVAFATFDDLSGRGRALYAGGDFTTAGGNVASHIAR